MVGISLPGVGLPPRSARRRIHQHHRVEDHPNHAQHSDLTTTLNETAFRARNRLDRKLGYYKHPIFRPRTRKARGRRDMNHKEAQGTCFDAILQWLMKNWDLKFHLFRSKLNDTKTCAICLEDLEGEEELIMTLSCSHKYHTHCLLPWITEHSYCPYCRTPSDQPSSAPKASCSGKDFGI